MSTPRIEDVFTEALAWPPKDRDHRLDEACGGDVKLRAEVESLLEAYAQAGQFMAKPSVEPALSEQPGEGPGTSIGRYHLLQLIGEGGFGAVFMAEQREPVKRTVALKIIKLGMDTKQVIARFEAERQALAMMDHPSIAKVLDAGATVAGRPYFVMELVRGDPITQFCDRQNLSIPQRLELFQQVCQAVQHAHQKGIIHRDLKPSNILVGEIDGRPTPKIIDFGIAKATGGHVQLTDKTLFTDFRQFIGTPEYMSPEQAGMGAVDIDTRSDIYSLGVLLYELLTGGPPFDPRKLRSAAWDEMRRIIREDDPERPSTRLHTRRDTREVAAHRGAEPARLIGLVRGDLDWIVMKSLEKDRARRYETASALAMDIGRHLVGEPVVAAPPSRLYRARKFVRRNRTGVLAASLVAAALVLGVIGTSVGLVRANKAEDQSEQRASDLQQVVDFQQAQLADLNPRVMGEGLRNSLLAQRREKLEFGGVNDVQIQRDLDALELSLEGINFTNVSIASLYENIFEPALKEIDARFGEQPLVQAQLLQSIASILRELSMPEQAKAPQERALEIRRRELGDAHPDTLHSCTETVKLYRSFGRFDEAEQLARRTVQTARRELGVKNRVTLYAINQLGVVLHARGEDPESERVLREVWEIGRHVLGEEHSLVLGAKSNVAILLWSQWKEDEAIAIWRELLDTHPNLVKAHFWLGKALRTQGKLEEAEPHLRKGLEGRRRRSGEESWGTLEAKNQMIYLLTDMYNRDGDVSKLQEAADIGANAIEDARTVLGYERPGVEWMLASYARVLTPLGDFEQAEALLLEAEARLADTSVPLRSDVDLADTTLNVTEAFVELYEAWHAVEPDAGHEARAVPWRARLEEARAAAARFEPPFEPPADSDG